MYEEELHTQGNTDQAKLYGFRRWHLSHCLEQIVHFQRSDFKMEACKPEVGQRGTMRLFKGGKKTVLEKDSGNLFNEQDKRWRSHSFSTCLRKRLLRSESSSAEWAECLNRSSD